MENAITDLVERFERGNLSRRELIRGLALLAASGAAAKAAAQPTPFASTRIDHVSIQVSDLQRSIDFYRNVFGLEIINRDEPNEIVRMGTTRIIVSLHHKAPMGIVDHFAIAVEGFDRDSATRSLSTLGLEAEQNLDYGFYVRDPEGIPVQMVAS